MVVLKKTLRNIAIGTIIAIVVVVSVYGYFYWKYAPHLNPKPQYFMTVKGYIDPAVKDQVQLTWIMRYYSNNPNCEITVNWLEGVSVPRERDDVAHVTPNSTGHYQYQFALDKYNTGFCEWRVIALDYKTNAQVSLDDAYTAVFFSKHAKPFKNTTGTEIWKCTQKNCSSISLVGYPNYDKSISINQNYIYELNFLKGE